MAGATLGALWLAPPASSSCSTFHADPPPGYSGPALRGLHCSYDEYAGDGEDTWTVPAGVSKAEFWVLGADDPAVGAGGSVRATLTLTPGEEVTLLLGHSGGASAVHRQGALLLRGAGGNGVDANYAAPGASDVEMQPAGGPNPPYPGAGSAYITWYEGQIDGQDGGGSRPPLERCVVPRLRGMRPAAAREAIAAADCSARAFARKPARRAMRGRIVSQRPRPGTVLPAGSRIAAAVGRRP